MTVDELLTALDANYEGQEGMRQYLLNRVPKWGNGRAEVDAIARQVADHFCDTVHGLRNGRGGGCQAALFTLTAQWTLGEHTSALPDGRKAHEPLAPGVGAAHGQDKAGVTALIESVTQLDFANTPNGSVLDVMLHPTAVRGPEGLDAFVGLIRTFFERGGYAIQFNVVDPDVLRQAQREPERFATLQIRVTGWSVYFTELTREEQDTFIERCVHGL
jgi:formate C-acetyltransferase